MEVHNDESGIRSSANKSRFPIKSEVNPKRRETLQRRQERGKKYPLEQQKQHHRKLEFLRKIPQRKNRWKRISMIQQPANSVILSASPAVFLSASTASNLREESPPKIQFEKENKNSANSCRRGRNGNRLRER